MATTGSKKTVNPPGPSDRPAARQSKAKGSGRDGDSALPRPASTPIPPSRSHNSQMAARREAALAADRLARDARLDARRQKTPAAVSSDGPFEPLAQPAETQESVGSSSVLSGTEPERSEGVSEMTPPLDADSSSGGGTATAPPTAPLVAQSATTGSSAVPSQTPSLASLMNPASSISGAQTARSDRTSNSSSQEGSEDLHISLR
ncbi:hypothetical protein B0H14DRAFT_2555056 [Mycena olivaceomarginata]|nr:hypothetical protein B0H14DRAFT_2555056 [Mycena olivaceomarginata]